MLIMLSMAVVALAGFVQGLTCFGFALVSMPFLAGLLPLQLVVPTVVLMSLGTNLAVLRQVWRSVELAAMWRLVLASLLIAPLGTCALLWLNAEAIKLLAGVVMVGFALMMLGGRAFPIRDPGKAFLSVGAMSGFLNGSVAMSGPPVALFLSSQGAGKDRFRANLTAYATILNLGTVASQGAGGLLTRALMGHLAALIPAMLLGVVLGTRAVRHVDEQRFRRLTLGLIVVSGLWTAGNALKHLLV